MSDNSAAASAHEQRSRLIDHFKRAYQIIVGLAVTLACGKVFEQGTFNFCDPVLLQFLIFFVTVVPIFHGGDRSLDLKYLGAQPTRFVGQMAYVWDIYMLLITAIFFVKIAQAMPGPGLVFGGSSSPANPWLFYEWMAAMLFVDVAILIIDWGKSGLLKTRAWKELNVYWIWVVLNFALGLVCYLIPEHDLTPESVGLIVLAAALLRTFLDYLFGRKFMFP